jgi:hypothetical protein
MVTFTVLSVVSLAVATICPLQPKAKIVIRVPRGMALGKLEICVYLIIEQAQYKNVSDKSRNNNCTDVTLIG